MSILEYMGIDEDRLWDAGTTSRRSDGIYAGLKEPGAFARDCWERPGHACSRVCPEHGDLHAVDLGPLWEVEVTMPVTFRLRAPDQKSAERIAVQMKLEEAAAIGLPVEIESKQVANA